MKSKSSTVLKTASGGAGKARLISEILKEVTKGTGQKG